MCQLHVADCTRCHQVAACWQTSCAMVNPLHEMRTCGGLVRKQEPAGLCTACLARGPQTPKAGIDQHTRRNIKQMLAGGKNALLRFRLRFSKNGEPRHRQAASCLGPLRQQTDNAQANSDVPRARELGYRIPQASSHRAAVYHPDADRNTHRSGRVLYRAISPSTNDRHSIVRVHSARESGHGEAGRPWSVASASSSVYSTDPRRGSWPPPRLHLRPYYKPPIKRQDFFAAMEDVVPRAGGMVSLPRVEPRGAVYDGRPTSW